jgi:hypothetical protein
VRQDVGSLSPLATNTGMAHSPTASYWACHVPILQSGHHAARTIMRRLHGQEPRPFHYRDLGTMATISRFRAVAGIGPIRIAGLAGWLLWLLVHLVFITGFKNRVAAVANSGRAERLPHRTARRRRRAAELGSGVPRAP